MLLTVTRASGDASAVSGSRFAGKAGGELVALLGCPARASALCGAVAPSAAVERLADVAWVPPGDPQPASSDEARTRAGMTRRVGTRTG